MYNIGSVCLQYTGSLYENAMRRAAGRGRWASEAEPVVVPVQCCIQCVL